MYDLYVMNKSTRLRGKVLRPKSGRFAAGSGEVRTISAAQARARFSEVVNRIAFGRERVVLTRRGRPFAAVVPIEDLALLEKIEDQSDAQDFRVALKQARREPTVSWEELKRELGL